MYTVQKERRIIIFLLFYFWHQTLYGTVLHHDNARPHENHTTQFLANNNVQNSPLACPVPGSVKPRVVQVCWRQSECLCKCVWVVLGTQGVVGHPSTNDLQPDPVHAWEMLDSYWFSRRTHPLLIRVSLSCKIPSDWTFPWTRRVSRSLTLTWISCRIKCDELVF